MKRPHALGNLFFSQCVLAGSLLVILDTCICAQIMQVLSHNSSYMYAKATESNAYSDVLYKICRLSSISPLFVQGARANLMTHSHQLRLNTIESLAHEYLITGK